MDEINAVLELFISCRDSSWPLVRLDAEEKLLTQHLLLAASMDREEVATLIGTCFEADHNKEINFLSFWAGMEQLLELLGLRDSSCYVDNKVYGLQVFRDSLLAEAAHKHQGPTNSVLLSRDDVLDVIQRTSHLVEQRNLGSGKASGVPFDKPDGGGSTFWKEVYKETASLDRTALLSITELSMMVYEFLKGYVSESCSMNADEALKNDKEVSIQASDESIPKDHLNSKVNNEASISDADKRLCVNEPCGECVLRKSSDDKGQVEGQEIPSRHASGGHISSPLDHRGDREVAKYEFTSEQCQQIQEKQGPECPSEGWFPPSSARSEDPWANSKLVEAAEAATKVLHAAQRDSEGPLTLLRQLLEASTNLALQAHIDRGYKQKLKYLHAAAVDCLDRIGQDSEKQIAEAHDAASMLERIKREKQRMQDQLTEVLQHQSQLESQQEQHRHTREELDRLRDVLRRQSDELADARSSLQKKTQDVERHVKENVSLKEQRDELTLRLNTAVKGEEDARKELDVLCQKFEAERAALEGKLRLVEDSATAAETARRQQSSEAHSNEIALREQVRNLEQEKHRLHQDAEEADILVSQLQTRLEEKLQQVAILEVKNKQQYRMLQQVRGVRDSLLHLLQEGERKPTSLVDAQSAEGERPELNDAERMKGALKAAQAHIKELEVFVEEMRREERRAVHAHPARYETASLVSHQSPGGTNKLQEGTATAYPFKKVRSLGVEVDAAMTLSGGNARSVVDNDAKQGGDSPHLSETKGSSGDTSAITKSLTRKGLTSLTDGKNEDQSTSEHLGPQTQEDRQLRIGSAHAPSLVSLSSEVSTAVAASRDAPSLLSSAEVEDVFGEFENEERERRCEAHKQKRLGISDAAAGLAIPTHSGNLGTAPADLKVSRRASSSNRIQLQKLRDSVTSQAASSPSNSVLESTPDGGQEGSFDLGNSKNSASSDGSFLMLSPCSTVTQSSKTVRDAIQCTESSEIRHTGSRSIRQLFSSLGSCAPLSARSDVYARSVEHAKTYDSLPRITNPTECSRGSKGRISSSSAVAISASAGDFVSLRRGGSSRSQEGNRRESEVSTSKNTAAFEPDDAFYDKQKTMSQECVVKPGSVDRPRRTVSLGISVELEACKGSDERGGTKSGGCPERSVGETHSEQSIELSPKGKSFFSSASAEIEGDVVSPLSGRQMVKYGESLPNNSRQELDGNRGVANLPNSHPSRCKESATKERRNKCSRSSSSDFSPEGLLGGKSRATAQAFTNHPQKKEMEGRNDNRKTSEQQGKSQPYAPCPDSNSLAVESKSKEGRPCKFNSNRQSAQLRSESSECPASDGSGFTVTPNVYQHPLARESPVEDVGMDEKAEEKIRSEGAASAAALLAAAAEVVDASFQQQQLMMSQQRQHHEDIQMQQQRRIDMLQEQLEVLLRRERLKDRGEQQQQKRLIKSLQAKLHVLQQRQDEKDRQDCAHRVFGEREFKSKGANGQADVFSFSSGDDRSQFQPSLHSDKRQCLSGGGVLSSMGSTGENTNRILYEYRNCVDADSDSDSINSCNTSKILSSQCSTPAVNSAVDDTPTTTSSPFISATPTASLYASLAHTQEQQHGFSKDADGCGVDHIAYCMTHHAQSHPLDTLFRHSPRSQNRLSGKDSLPSYGASIGNSYAVRGYRRSSSSSTMLWSAKEAPQTLDMGKVSGSYSGIQGVKSSFSEDPCLGLASYSAPRSSPRSEQVHEFRSFMSSGHSQDAASSHRKMRSVESNRAVINGLNMQKEGMHPVSRAECATTTPRSIDSASFLGECTRRDRSSTEKVTRLKAESRFKVPPALPSARSVASSSVSYATAPALHAGRSAADAITRNDQIRNQRIQSSEFLAFDVPSRFSTTGYTSSHTGSGRSLSKAGRHRTNTIGKDTTNTESSKHRDRQRSKAAPSPASTRFSARAPGSQVVKRTVQSLVSANTSSAMPSAEERRRMGGSTAGSVGETSSISSCRQALLGKRFENSEAAAAYYRSVTTRKPPLECEDESGRGSKKKGDEGVVSETQNEKQSKTKENEGAFAALQQLNSDWKDFNENLINQMQKWIS